MLAKILVHPDLVVRKQEMDRLIHNSEFIIHNSDQLYLDETEKLGVETAKKIREHLSTKAFQSKAKAVVVINADDLTTEAQNSLLKTLEEPPEEALILFGVSAEDKLLPTILSRCEVINLNRDSAITLDNQYDNDIKKLLASNIEERFTFVEKLEDKEAFLLALIKYLHREKSTYIYEDLLLVDRWQSASVNSRAILEYIVLKLPK